MSNIEAMFRDQRWKYSTNEAWRHFLENNPDFRKKHVASALELSKKYGGRGVCGDFTRVAVAYMEANFCETPVTHIQILDSTNPVITIHEVVLLGASTTQVQSFLAKDYRACCSALVVDGWDGKIIPATEFAAHLQALYDSENNYLFDEATPDTCIIRTGYSSPGLGVTFRNYAHRGEDVLFLQLLKAQISRNYPPTRLHALMNEKSPSGGNSVVDWALSILDNKGNAVSASMIEKRNNIAVALRAQGLIPAPELPAEAATVSGAGGPTVWAATAGVLAGAGAGAVPRVSDAVPSPDECCA